MSSSQKPKKSLSQNFLTNPRAAERLVEAARPQPDDVVLEIGPGRGILTERLLEQVKRVVAVEKDKALAKNLREVFSEAVALGQLVILEGDCLDEQAQQKAWTALDGSYKIVASIPYSVTGAILRSFLQSTHPPRAMALLVQKEVAERIIAQAPNESLLSISVKAYGEPKYIGTVKAGSFYPQPKVDSAILRVSNISKDFFTSGSFSEDKFFALVSAGFAHKRKLVKNNLKNAFPETELGLSHIPDHARAQELSLGEWGQILIDRK